MPHKKFTLTAPAKLNLFLHITGKRQDGYHLLQSVMIFVDVGDTMEFYPHDGFLIDAEGPFAGDLPPPGDNIVYHAARALSDSWGVPLSGGIQLYKNLPIASGVAGGSSNAATALLGLSKLWGLPDDRDRLHKIAVKLGADVPACLVKRPVWAEGIGEKMSPLPHMPPLHFVLVNPMVATPTAEVFARFRNRVTPPIQYSGRKKTMQEWISDLRLYRNDLTEAAIEVCPDISTVLAALRETPNCHLSRLSGSGATCFGIYDSPPAAQAAVNKLRQQHPRWWVTAANLIA
jgi:4-diphosphocytidyl-2-C-methyl-D-erythritol kinase